ncbi:hypothetical protein GJ744_002606 [Endocarpon pusillum]|uniref:Uncharacterized protein n=1 Tax=Endocarpon pusillum TaxID=364733 RepID=A0A8H7ABN1_9EURO|nr:hypothetical protein GJ744_002606 [Endocarpon pusillum]
MRMLLHRQTILFLLQPSERRNWPQNGIQEWPPLFSDSYSDTLVGGSTPFRRQGVPSPVETAVTHLSASICVSSAISQIEGIDMYLHSKVTGGWWDFNCTFNALCVLCGAMALHRQDLVAVIPDLLKAWHTIQRGFALIRHMSMKTEGANIKIRQSERFLDRLVRATVRQNEKDRTVDADKSHQGVPLAPSQSSQSKNLTTIPINAESDYPNPPTPNPAAPPAAPTHPLLNSNDLAMQQQQPTTPILKPSQSCTTISH